MKYYTMPEMLEMIDEPNRTSCKKLYNNNIELIKKMPGSSFNHQAWPGGYHDHITETMNICIALYPIYNIRQLNFSLSDALLIMFLHDLEKPWRDVVDDIVQGELDMDIYNDAIDYYLTKRVRKEFRSKKIEEYDINLTHAHMNALRFIEGEDGEYSGNDRAMNELAAFCHIADISSARIWYNYGKEGSWTI
jgi:hypothetical protein